MYPSIQRVGVPGSHIGASMRQVAHPLTTFHITYRPNTYFQIAISFRLFMTNEKNIEAIEINNLMLCVPNKEFSRPHHLQGKECNHWHTSMPVVTLFSDTDRLRGLCNNLNKANFYPLCLYTL